MAKRGGVALIGIISPRARPFFRPAKGRRDFTTGLSNDTILPPRPCIELAKPMKIGGK
jgi:hypothetical protein